MVIKMVILNLLVNMFVDIYKTSQCEYSSVEKASLRDELRQNIDDIYKICEKGDLFCTIWILHFNREAKKMNEKEFVKDLKSVEGEEGPWNIDKFFLREKRLWKMYSLFSHEPIERESDTVRFAMVTIGISLIIRGLLPFFLQCGLALADQGCCTHYYSFIKLFSGLLFSSLFNLKSLWDVLFYHIKILRCLCAFQLLNLSLIWTIFPS